MDPMGAALAKLLGSTSRTTRIFTPSVSFPSVPPVSAATNAPTLPLLSMSGVISLTTEDVFEKQKRRKRNPSYPLEVRHFGY